MEHLNTQVEVVLFFIDDKNAEIESILPGFKFNKNIKPSLMLDLCVKSITKNMSNAKIVLVTNSSTFIHAEIKNIEVINADQISHEKLIYDLHLFRREYIKSKIGSNTNVIFTDIDVLVNKDLGKLFDQDFDLATTIDPNSNASLDDRGLPCDGSLMFNFTGGIYFAKCNENSLNFYDEFLKKWKYLSTSEIFNNYGVRSIEVEQHFLRWWGELHTLSLIFGLDILSAKKDHAIIDGAKWLFFPERIYNYAPEIINKDGSLSIKVTDINDIGVIHFRGIRKIFMQIIFDKFFSS